MASEEEIKMIVDYALKDDTNLEVAVKIASAFDDISKRIIIDFLYALENILKQSLDDHDQWIITNELKNDVFAKDKGFYIEKRAWKGNYQIGIQSLQYGARKFIIGLGKDKMLSPIEGGNLKKQIDEQYRPGLADEWWEWYRNVEGDYETWDNEKVLIDMYRKEKAVNYFKGPIITIARIASPVIDKAVKSM